MKSQRYTGSSLRSLANWLAMLATERYKQAAEHEKNASYFKQKVEIIRDFLLNSPYVLYTIMYFLLLMIDAIFMEPIIGVVVSHGFMLTGKIHLLLFILIYIVLVSALTIGAAYGFAKSFDTRLRDLQVELDTFSQPGVVRSVIFQQVVDREKRNKALGIFFSIVLMVFLILLSLYRNYLTNNYGIFFNTPSDWLNLVLPLAMGAALIFFGIYKDILVRKIVFGNKYKVHSTKLDTHFLSFKDYSRQAIEQDNEAEKINDTIERSADLKWVLLNHQETSVINNIFTRTKSISLVISNNGSNIEGIQVIGFTDDECSAHTISNKEGFAELTWQSDCNFIKDIQVGQYHIPGTRWFDGDTIRIDLSKLKQDDKKKSGKPNNSESILKAE
jgi:hypothetical protein